MSGGWSQTQIGFQKWEVLPQSFSLMSRAQLLWCLGARMALAAPFSLSPGGGPATGLITKTVTSNSPKASSSLCRMGL